MIINIIIILFGFIIGMLISYIFTKQSFKGPSSNKIKKKYIWIKMEIYIN